jgi:hypothetical protein
VSPDPEVADDDDRRRDLGGKETQGHGSGTLEGGDETDQARGPYEEVLLFGIAAVQPAVEAEEERGGAQSQ